MIVRKLFIVIFITLFASCKRNTNTSETLPEKQQKVVWRAYDESNDLEATRKLEQSRMHLKLVNSKVHNKNDIWNALESELDYFSEETYNDLKKFILEKNIPEIQQNVKEGKLTYEDLTRFYIYRIRKYESDNCLSLNAVIFLNSDVIEQARELDKKDKSEIDVYSVYGMPILLKDNINTVGMPTTGGAEVLKKNQTDNAFITDQLLSKKALILGKANLSEWAYFFCSGCPVGYSAIGGQTLNPYGRMVFESGGSSSGSGAAVAANFCVAAIGTETSGSILSPSSQNSIVGLKPTIGVLSRTGIVPISSTLDTPGPMTKSVIDNAIVMNAVLGKDIADNASVTANNVAIKSLKEASLKNKKLGVIKGLLSDSLYNNTVKLMQQSGAEIFELEPKPTPLPGFLTILNIDMKNDLPEYLEKYASKDIKVKNIDEIVVYNKEDSIVRMPYGQDLFVGILKDKTTEEELNAIKANLETVARKYFDQYIDAYNLDAVLSINNYHAGYAAVAKYPALTVPMGYSDSGEPKGLTFIGKPFSENNLYQLGKGYEELSKKRKLPVNYQ